MLLVLVLMQLMPPDAHDAVAEAMGARYNWNEVRTESVSAWEITVAMPQHKRPEFSLQQAGPVAPMVDVRTFSLASELPAGAAVATLMLNPSFDDTINLQSSSHIAMTMPIVDASTAGELMALVSGNLSSSATLLARLTSRPEPSVQIPGGNGGGGGVGTVPPPGNPGGPGNPNGPGGGVGSPIPEPTSGFLLAMALPLLARKRRMRNPVH